MLEIRRLRSGEEEELYRFRYQVYVREMRRPQKHADHSRETIRAPLDATAINIVAWKNDRIVGCTRANYARDGNLLYYPNFLRMADLGREHPEYSSISTRLMVAPELRRSPLAARLAAEVFEVGLRDGIRWNFLDCNDHLVEFFTRQGYEFTHKAVHEEYGCVNIMRLNMMNHTHLRTCRSIFLKPLERFLQEKERTAEWSRISLARILETDNLQ